MIIGSGDLGSVLNDRPGALFFASGVSNSLETSNRKFWRERDLLLEQPKNLCLFYFGTISKFYPNPSPYVQHKKQMENLVKMNWGNYVILRIGNIDFGINPNTFLNKMRAMKAAGTPLPIRDEYKFMITKEHLLSLTDHLPLDNRIEICAFSYMRLVKDLL